MASGRTLKAVKSLSPCRALRGQAQSLLCVRRAPKFTADCTVATATRRIAGALLISSQVFWRAGSGFAEMITWGNSECKLRAADLLTKVESLEMTKPATVVYLATCEPRLAN